MLGRRKRMTPALQQMQPLYLFWASPFSDWTRRHSFDVQRQVSSPSVYLLAHKQALDMRRVGQSALFNHNWSEAVVLVDN